MAFLFFLVLIWSDLNLQMFIVVSALLLIIKQVFTEWLSRPMYHSDLDLKLKILKHENFHGNGMKSLYNDNYIGMII